MDDTTTTGLLIVQPICKGEPVKTFVAHPAMKLPTDPSLAGRWTKEQRDVRAMSAADLARRISGLAREHGDPTVVSQQVVSKFEQGNTKRMPAWARFIVMAFQNNDDETKEDPYLGTGLIDHSVSVKRLPTFVGLGGGGTGEGDPEVVAFSRDLIERELRADPANLLAMIAEGNSMEPEFFGGDQILVDTRRKSLAQPGAFCLWDGDGHVIKFLEKVPGSDPAMVRIISLNPLYQPHERLIDEINLIGRVIWFGRRVQ